jgi:hypothetical protein
MITEEPGIMRGRPPFPVIAKTMFLSSASTWCLLNETASFMRKPMNHAATSTLAISSLSES